MSWKHRASRLLSRSRLSGRRGSRPSKGAPGVDAVTIAEFESDLKNNLYKIWNRLSSGTCFPPPVRAVEIPKPHGGGTRIPGGPPRRGGGGATGGGGGDGGEGRAGLPPRSPRLPAGAPRAGCGSRLPASVLGERLGDRSGHPEVLRHHAMAPGGQGDPGGHRPAVGGAVRAALASRTTGPARRHLAAARPRNPAGLGGLARDREPVP